MECGVNACAINFTTRMDSSASSSEDALEEASQKLAELPDVALFVDGHKGLNYIDRAVLVDGYSGVRFIN